MGCMADYDDDEIKKMKQEENNSPQAHPRLKKNNKYLIPMDTNNTPPQTTDSKSVYLQTVGGVSLKDTPLSEKMCINDCCDVDSIHIHIDDLKQAVDRVKERIDKLYQERWTEEISEVHILEIINEEFGGL